MQAALYPEGPDPSFHEQFAIRMIITEPAAKTSQKETAEGDMEQKREDLDVCIQDLGAATEAPLCRIMAASFLSTQIRL